MKCTSGDLKAAGDSDWLAASEDEEEDDEDPDAGDVAVKKKPDPPPSWFDDEHPLADQYRLLGAVTLGEAWFMPHHRAVAIYLMRRDPDLEIPDEPPKA